MPMPRSLALLIGAAFLLRLLYGASLATETPYIERGGDEYRYLKLGYDLTTGRSYSEIGLSNAPLYALALGLILRPFLLPHSGEEAAAIHAGDALPPELLRDAAAPIRLARALGAALGAALVWLGHRGALLLSGNARAAAITALALAFGPVFILEAAVIGSEMLYIACLCAAIVALLAAAAAENARPAATCLLALSGVLFGLATLTRQPSLLMPPLFAALWLWRGRRAALAPATALLAGFAVVLAGWALYAQLAWGRPMLVSDASIGALLFRGASGGGSMYEVDEQTGALTGSDEERLPYEEAAWALIREDPLGYLARRGQALLSAIIQPHGTLHFSGPSIRALLADWLRGDGAGLPDITRADGFWGKAALWLSHLAALGGGLAGGWRLWRRARHRFALAIVALAIAYTIAIHFLLEANARYLFPNEPLWWLLAGGALAGVALRPIQPHDTREGSRP